MRHRLYALAMSCCLAAGATVTASCGGCDKDNIQVSISPGQDVIRVDANTGVATGLRAGVAEAIVTGKRYGELGSVTITVQGS